MHYLIVNDFILGKTDFCKYYTNTELNNVVNDNNLAYNL